MKPVDPSTAFLGAVHKQLAELNCDWDTAWDSARRCNKDLYERMVSAPNPRAVQMANADDAESKRRTAEAQFIELVYESMRRTGDSYTQSWNRMQEDNPDLYRLAAGITVSKSAPSTEPNPDLGGSSSSSPGSEATTPPVWSPGALGLLGLPADAPNDLADVAWRANGGQVSLVRPRAVWEAVVGYFGAKKIPIPRQEYSELYRRASAALW